ncbi:MAG TPA: hypothetical protein VMZ22_03230 [Acidimicrobiales bacterium]|nr:hypothetical protein [Acidimicrobiales bacterium]
MAATSLLELIERLLSDGDAAADFQDAPDDFLSEHGLGDLSGADVLDALSLGFDSVAPDLAVRLVLPEGDTDNASAADALGDLLDAAPADSVLEDAGADDFEFGLGDLLDGATFGSGDSDADDDVDLLDLDLDLGFDADADAGDDLDTATFDQGFGSGDLDVDHLHDLDDADDLHLAVDDHDHHHNLHHDLHHGPDGL